jgi:hypothetical protein
MKESPLYTSSFKYFWLYLSFYLPYSKFKLSWWTQTYNFKQEV